MAQPTIEQCLVTLTEILNRQNSAENIRTLIEKRLKHLKPFSGEQGTLPSFIANVEQVFDEYGQVNREIVYSVVYNKKIEGAAKNFLAIESPTSWEQCVQKLKIHFRPTKDVGSILKSINYLKVHSISELLDKIQEIINYTTECATFNENGLDIANCLNSTLILKIKELTAGALAAEICDSYSLTNIRTTLFKYLGQDEYNLRSEKPHNFTHKNKHTQYQNNKNNNYNQQNHLNKHNYSKQRQPDQNNFTQNQPYRHNDSKQFRNNNNNMSGQARNRPQNNANNNENSGQFRSRQFRAEPMEVDVLSNRDRQENNQIENHEFFIN